MALSVVGGGDSVTSFTRYIDMSKFNYVSTAGGALIRYLSGVQLPLFEAMSKRESIWNSAFSSGINACYLRCTCRLQNS
jgi:hypothetical protein